MNPPKNPQIRSAWPLQEINYGSANTILAQTSSFRHYYWALLSLWILHLEQAKRIQGVKFVETSPINEAGASGKGFFFIQKMFK